MAENEASDPEDTSLAEILELTKELNKRIQEFRAQVKKAMEQMMKQLKNKKKPTTYYP